MSSNCPICWNVRIYIEAGVTLDRIMFRLDKWSTDILVDLGRIHKT